MELENPELSSTFICIRIANSSQGRLRAVYVADRGHMILLSSWSVVLVFRDCGDCYTVEALLTGLHGTE